MRRHLYLFLALLVGLFGIPAAAAEDKVGCADPDHPGGEWRSYGHDLANTRSQPEEDVIGTGNVAGLEAAWSFIPSDHVSSGGGFYNTPVVADGCVYLGTNTGWVFSLNADSGEVVWSTRLQGSPSTLIGGVITGSPTVQDDVVYLSVNRPGTPYVAALDRETGQRLWFATVETGWPALIVSSPVLLNGMIFQGFAGGEGGAHSRGGYAFVDASRECDDAEHVECFDPVDGASGGQRRAHGYTITDAEYEDGYRGGSIWCSSAADAEEGYVYACGGNPQSMGKHGRYTNSMLKIDADPGRGTFGEIVSSYKGNPDSYVEGLDRQPACDLAPGLGVLWSVSCVELDLDFGASPNLFRDELGQLVVGNLQKSGVYHAAYADSMGGAWTTTVSVPCLACNASSGAYADGRVFTIGSPPSWVVGIATEGQQKGRHQWVSPLGDAVHYHSVSHANGVVYGVDGYGTLYGMDAETGLQLLRRPIVADLERTGSTGFDSSSGVSIARNTVYAAAGTFVVAYRASS